MLWDILVPPASILSFGTCSVDILEPDLSKLMLIACPWKVYAIKMEHSEFAISALIPSGDPTLLSALILQLFFSFRTIEFPQC